MNFFTFTGAIALSTILAGCAILTVPKQAPKAYIPEGLMEKEVDHTWEVTDQASFDAAAQGINNAGENKKHVVTVKGSLAAKASYSTVFYITAKKVAVVLEGDATISFSSDGTRARSIFSVGEEQAIIIKDIKLQGSNSNIYPLVMVWGGGKFIMEGSASVQGNTANVGGEASLASSITGKNLATICKVHPGGVSVNSGIFIMRGSASVRDNTSSGKCGSIERGEGGGVAITSYPSGATFIMQDNASITGNTASEKGGGVYKNGGTFTMQDNAKISGNTADTGGGVYGRVTIQDNAKVSGNTAKVGKDMYNN
jgi:hypothetical protein